MKAFAKDDFFAFRDVLKKSRCTDFEALKVVKKNQIMRQPSLLCPLVNGLSPIEEIFRSNEQKSAKYISLIWEEYQFWNNESFLTWKRDESCMLPIEHVIKSNNILNFYSFLIFDWHNPDQQQLNKDKKYFLETKNDQLIAVTGESLFQKLYKIIDQKLDTDFDVCLRILYEYLDEMDQDDKTRSVEDLKKLVSIQDLFMLSNKEYRIKFLEVLTSYWSVLQIDCAGYKQQVFHATDTKKGETSLLTLVYNLFENRYSKFETNFQSHVILTTARYGNYHQNIMRPLARLLLQICQKLELAQVSNFIYQRCSYVEVNSKPLTNIQELYRFNNKNIFPLNKHDLHALVS